MMLTSINTTSPGQTLLPVDVAVYELEMLLNETKTIFEIISLHVCVGMRMVILQTFPDICMEVLRSTGIFVGSCMVAIIVSCRKRLVCVMLKE